MKKNRKHTHSNTAIVAMIAIAIILVFTMQGTNSSNTMTGFAVGNRQIGKTGDQCFDTMNIAGQVNAFGKNVVEAYCACMKKPGERSECRKFLESDHYVGIKIEEQKLLNTCFDRMEMAGYIQKHGSTRVNAYCSCMDSVKNKFICERELIKPNEFYPMIQGYKKN